MVKVERLKNGVKVAIKRRSDLNSVTVSVWVKAGAAYERDENRGIAHFLEHMIFNGSKNLPPGSADALIESVGGEINAATSYDYTYYYINLPSEHFKTALYVLSELILNPLLSEDMVKKEIPIVLEEIARSKDNPHEVFTEKFLEKMYKEAPYKFPILGFKETVSKFSSKLVREFYESYYTPGRLTVSICGNVNEDEILKECERLFGNFDREENREKPQPERSPLNPEFFKMEHPAVSIPYLLLGWKLGPASRADINYDVLDSILSSGRSSVLYRRLREEGIAFSASSNYQNLLLGSNFLIGISTEKIDEALKRTREILNEITNLTEEEFLLGKRKLFKNEIFSREDGHAEAEAIGFALGIMEDLGYYTEAIPDLEKLNLEEFKKAVGFLNGEPLVGLLVPAT